MPRVTNSRLLFNQIPSGFPVPGKTTVLDEGENIDLDAPLDGGVLIKVLVLSIDPYLRGRMRDSSIVAYSSAYRLNHPIANFGVGVVLRSENPEVHQGDHLYGSFEFQLYVVKKNISQYKLLENKERLPWSVYVGAAGMPGQTAYIGWKLYAKPKKGETLFVTTAAGAVGSLVIQLAKADGLKVIASVGTDAKVASAKELGADVAFNYRTKNTKEALQELGHGIDIVWDHVGGETLEASIGAANNYARFINCGAISAYTSLKEPYGVKNLHLIITKRLKLQGFIVLDHFEDMLPEFYDVIPKKIAEGEIIYREHVYRGLKEAEQALLDVLRGDNTAKAVVVLADG